MLREPPPSHHQKKGKYQRIVLANELIQAVLNRRVSVRF